MNKTALSLYYQASGLISYYTPVQIFLNSIHGFSLVWWRSNNVCGRGEVVSYAHIFLCHHFAYPPQTSLPIIAHGNVSSLANLFTPAYGSSTKWPAYSCYIHKACHDICPTTKICRSFCQKATWETTSSLALSIAVPFKYCYSSTKPCTLVWKLFRKSFNKTVYNIRSP